VTWDDGGLQQAARGSSPPEASDHFDLPWVVRVKLARRIAIAQGHLSSVERSLQQRETLAPDLLLQVAAVRGALARVSEVLCEEFLIERAGARTSEARSKAIRELVRLFR
jgi:DNA-binding FrmR family transcriptional regulator